MRETLRGETMIGGEKRLVPPLRLVVRGIMLLVDSRPLLLVVLNLALGGLMFFVNAQRFLQPDNLSSVLLDASESGILTIGMMLLLIAGVVDLSIGGVLALAGILAAMAANNGVPAPLSWLVGIGVGAACGVGNAAIVTKIRINALIATLATAGIFRGVSQIFAGTGVTTIVPGFAELGQGQLLHLQYPVWILLLLVAVFTLLANRGRFFRQFFFVGGNERAARLSGIDTVRVKFIGFVIMGALAGLAGVLTASRLNAAVVSAGTGVELNVITAAVLGGAALTGGSGSVPGGLLAILFISLIQNALIIAGVDVFWQQIVIGIVLIVAVSTEYLQSRRS